MREIIIQLTDADYDKIKAGTDYDCDLVRCKECKFGEPDTNGNGEDMILCQNKHNPIGFEDWLMPPEWYCADGKRRADDDTR